MPPSTTPPAPRRGAAKRDSRGRAGHRLDRAASGICHAYTPDGRCISLLKILLTNFCIYDCAYCINRSSSNVPRARFTVEEVVELTLDFYKRNYIEGLFLSSGIIRIADYTMEEMVRVARTPARGARLPRLHPPEDHPRRRPGAGRGGGRCYADRLSINIELPKRREPRAARAARRTSAGITPGHGRVVRSDRARQATGSKAKPPPRFAPAGQSTQMIVGADGADDAAILGTSAALYGSYGLRRVYYSAFSPIPDASRAPAAVEGRR